MENISKKPMLIQRVIKIKPTEIRSVIKAEKGGYAYDLVPKFRTSFSRTGFHEKITSLSVMEVIS